MAKVKFDVRGVESGGFDTPKPGLYRAKVSEVNQKESQAGNQMLEVILEISRGENKGARLWDYIVQNEASAWKMRQFLEAVGLVKGKKERGTLDTNKIVGTEIQVRVKNESWTNDDGETSVRARVGALMPMPEDEDDEDLEDEEVEDEDEDEDEDEEDEDEEDEDEEEEDEDEDEEDEEEESYDDWTMDELKAELKERGLKSSGTKRVLVKRLEKDDEAADDDDEPF